MFTPDIVKKYDPTGMLTLIEQFPEQVQEAVAIGKKADLGNLPEEVKDINSIIFLGMGGSAIGGDCLRSVLAGELRVPMQVSREYHLPAYVSEKTLVIASSYSGNTEETISALREAEDRKAKILCISTGGKLADIATEKGYPLITIPGGISPRAALGYSFFPILVAFSRLGLISVKKEAVAETIDVLEKMRLELSLATPGNPAQVLAQNLHGRIPLIYGAEGYRGVAASRWKGQINENSKHVAYWNAFAELNHNEIVGWENPELTKEIHLVVLRDREDVRMAKRIEVTEEIVRSRVHGITEVHSRGEHDITRMFSLIYFGDFVSWYLAILNSADPTPVRVIDYLKGELAKL
ncbi:MAG: bifunctional phosphoglucose/phosphomannose isomerase [Bacillota bacterium]|jgi:glucose/mannose-6-phosphate isomerase|nr:bifunctional phosphoglucose/phosphomannose isomerase [Bacillota bacterium]NLU55847.1 bifunctional phosphoglucose/phosphomannose isomerase [Bacillota bacterium]HOA91797.1 bifunctional phosphoglucose/phosphomannose isomerase [Bacillota bacterium]HOJ45703.1 bifunctional phosphoglucose/phosphomannose isomerase [Bacillota bacterium]HOP53331.1 bifunctional phosphoglucose/phosphomannose isomerase [Bacillota bacterium]